MGALIRSHDWAATPLGPPAGWPAPLKGAVRTTLTTGHPMVICWGQDLTCFYNDAFRASLGSEKHPSALGAPASRVWPEAWHLLGPDLARVMQGGAPSWHENVLVPVLRNGRLQDIWWTYSQGPIHDEASPNCVGGVMVICTETTERVLEVREHSLRLERLMALFEQAPGFISVTTGPNHVFEIVNAAHRKLMGGRDLTGLTVREAQPELETQGFIALLDHVYRSGEAYVGQTKRVTLRDPVSGAEREMFLDFIYQPIRDADGRVAGILCEGTEVTEAVRAQDALRQSEARWRGLFERMQEGFALVKITYDDAGQAIDFRVQEVNAAWEAQTGMAADQILDRSALLILGEEQPFWTAFYARVVETGQPAQLERWVKALDRWMEVRAYRIEPGYCAVLLLDITARKASEARLTLLAREVDHRAKNALAVVQAALRLTPRDDAQTYATAVEGRVAALARAQSLLAEASWSGAELCSLLRGELAPLLVMQRVELLGPPLLLPPGLAQPLSMAVHELATNAVKYGALSQPQGRVTVEWEVLDGSQGLLRLRWMEKGGPSVQGPPHRRGFGFRVLAGTVRGQIGGRVLLDWAQDGLVCEMQIPLAREHSDLPEDIQAKAG